MNNLEASMDAEKQSIHDELYSLNQNKEQKNTVAVQLNFSFHKSKNSFKSRTYVKELVFKRTNGVNNAEHCRGIALKMELTLPAKGSRVERKLYAEVSADLTFVKSINEQESVGERMKQAKWFYELPLVLAKKEASSPVTKS